MRGSAARSASTISTKRRSSSATRTRIRSLRGSGAAAIGLPYNDPRRSKVRGMSAGEARTRCARWSRSGWPTSSGSLENRLHLRRLKADVVRLGGRSRRRIGRWELRRRSQARLDRALVLRIDEDAGAVRDELGRAADVRRENRPLARERLEQCLAEGLDEARLADDVARRDPARDLLVWDAPYHADAVAALERVAQRPVAHEREPALAETLKRPREPHDVLALVEGADVEKGGPVGVPVQLLARRSEVGALEEVGRRR